MNQVKAKNMIAEIDVSGTYYPFFCCKTVEFNQTQELIEVTSVNSGASREYEAGMSTATLSVSGVTVMDNTDGRISITYLIQEAVRRVAQSMRIRLTDDDGGTLQISFSAIITTNTLSRSFGSYSQSVTGFQITGTPTISVVVPAPVPAVVQDPLYLTVVAGATSVSDPLLTVATVVILAVEREGTGHTEVSGTPGNREFLFTLAAGSISFDPTNPFNTGEVIYILYKK